MSVLTIPGHTLLTITRGLFCTISLVIYEEIHVGFLYCLLAVWPSSQPRNLLDRVHDQELANGIIGLCVPPVARPVVLAAHFSQDAVLPLRPFSQLVEVGVEMFARGEKGHVRRRRSEMATGAHPSQKKQADECRADGIDLDRLLPNSSSRVRKSTSYMRRRRAQTMSRERERSEL